MNELCHVIVHQHPANRNSSNQKFDEHVPKGTNILQFLADNYDLDKYMVRKGPLENSDMFGKTAAFTQDTTVYLLTKRKELEQKTIKMNWKKEFEKEKNSHQATKEKLELVLQMLNQDANDNGKSPFVPPVSVTPTMTRFDQYSSIIH